MYFGLFLASFLILNRKEPLKKNLIQMAGLGSGILVLFEVGLWYFVPYFMDKWAIDAVRDTPSRYLTNSDLLLTGAPIFVVSQLLLAKLRSRPIS